LIRFYSTYFDSNFEMRDNEVKVLRYLSTKGIAPKILYFANEHEKFGSFSIIEFFPGIPLSPLSVRPYLPEMIKILKKVHSIEVDPSFSQQGSFNELSTPFIRENLKLSEIISLNDVREDISNISLSIENIIEKYNSAFNKSIRNVFVHGDAHCGNILYDESDKTLRFIDWESAHVGNVLEDLSAMTTVIYPLFTEEEEKDFLNQYFQGTNEIINPEMMVLYHLYKFKKLTLIVAFLLKGLMKLQEKGEEFPQQLTGGLRFFIGQLKTVVELL